VSRVPTAVLISGGGSNMLALAKAAADPAYPANITLVIANRPDAGGIQRARHLGLATLVIDHARFGDDREAFERELDEALVANGIAFVALAGFMRVLTPWFVGRWQGRMINIHPSLLPKHKGLKTHARALAAGDKEHGCTVHWVTNELDAGAIIAQAKVPIFPGETPETLAERVLTLEHVLFPRALARAVASLPPS
jgi:formyltetrahydrofolate-dependent phosphoribosylglycinamide formyltransferase